MTRFLLDTNTVSAAIKGHPNVVRQLEALPTGAPGISAITEGELLFGLAKRPEAKRLASVVREFLRCVEVFPWDHSVAEYYGTLRAEMERRGKGLGAPDLLIAAHAMALGRVLVTSDRAFGQVDGLRVVDWTA